MKLVVLLLISCAMLACSKESAESAIQSGSGSLTGTWKMSEMRADPGDGSGKFLPTHLDVTITFTANGAYNDSRDDRFNRYTILSADTIKLFHNTHQLRMLLAIQELSASGLTYFCNWPWCGGPYGEKFVRL